MNFKVVLQEAEEGGYIVSCPALPGCHSQGDSMEEALKNIKEAIVGCLESLGEERTKLLELFGKDHGSNGLISDGPKAAGYFRQRSR
jgi:predicted RNase H-like HicB family nuclease